MTIHQCVPNMSGDVTTRDLKPGPGTGDLALQSQALIQALITVKHPGPDREKRKPYQFIQSIETNTNKHLHLTHSSLKL